MAKANKIFARYIISDVVIPKEDNLSDSDIDITNASLIGYEDEDGSECYENGEYLN